MQEFMSCIVNILLPTHNGAKFLSGMLESISAQSYRDIILTIRDDGSTDETYSLLSAWAAGRPSVCVSSGKNLGAMRSFFHLLQSARDSDYFAFADQDDVWLPEK